VSFLKSKATSKKRFGGAQAKNESAQASAIADMLAREKEEAARPRTGKPGPEMPVYGKPPEVSPKEQAARQKELDEKIKANQPPAPRPGIVPPKVSPEELQKMRQNRDKLLQKAQDLRNALKVPPPPVKTGAPPMPVRPVPRVITDPVRPAPTSPNVTQGLTPIDNNTTATSPVRPKPTPSPAPMPAVRGPFNTPDGNFDASKAPPLPPGAVYKKGGKVASTSRRGDGIAQRGKTKGKYI
jgi:hypothetical protein